MFEQLPLLDTKLGRFANLLESQAVAPGGPAAPTDILPMSIEAIREVESVNEDVRDWGAFTVLCLNYHFCCGWEKATSLAHSRSLTGPQEALLKEHIFPACARMIEGNPVIPQKETILKELTRKGMDYEGSTYVVMEDLDAEKIVACWPAKEAAAVQPITKFVKGITKESLEKPKHTILPEDEWPEQIPKSYVRADTETWEKIVAEGWKRGLFQPCPEKEVICDKQGRKILNGAGAVPKEKNGKMQQRFISIFCPINAVSQKISGDEETLPYVGQVSLLHIPDEQEILIDSEDMQSAFNLFSMPVGWRGMFCYEKQVRGRVMGLNTDDLCYVSLRTVPMGWISAVGVVQAAIRTLAFDMAKIPLDQEVQKWRSLPEGDRYLLYLDSVDQLRPVSKAMARIVSGEASEEHKKFEQVCQEMGLPRNESKRLAGALEGTLQGGELKSKEGIFTLQLSKMRQDVGMVLVLLSLRKWPRRETSGVIGRLVFAGAFRRPILAALSRVFSHYHEGKAASEPDEETYDEMLAMVGLLPLAFTNLRARVSETLHATDASPTGGGSCIAEALKRSPGWVDQSEFVCGECRRDMAEEIGVGTEIDCPMQCGKRFCGLDCFLEHKGECPNKGGHVPTFSERWSGPNAPLTETLVREGVAVEVPYDMRRDSRMDFFTDEGKGIWKWLDEREPEAEHHAPECKTFSRRRGQPFWIGRRKFTGPPALRDESNIMGFPSLKGGDAVKVRHGNKMALRSIQRCVDLDNQNKVFSLEHPYGSFMWYMKSAIDLGKRPGVRMAVFSNCCHGGRRKKWTGVLTNSKRIYDELHRPQCPHTGGESYDPYFGPDGYIVYPTEEEAEYPAELTQAYTKGLKAEFEARGFSKEESSEHGRKKAIREDLKKYHSTEEGLLKAVTDKVVAWEQEMRPGNERNNLMNLLRQGHYRGTDIRTVLEYNGERRMVPYPALRWVWREVLSYKWKHDGDHINVLEAQALFTHLRRISRESQNHHARSFVVVDSQVLFYAVGKGRSPSLRLNRVLRRLMALCLAADMLVLPIWTISAWNWADKPSRRADAWRVCDLWVWRRGPYAAITKHCWTTLNG